MSDIAVSVAGIWKEFRIGKTQATSLRDESAGWLRGIVGRRVQEQPFWALRDVTFDVPRGQVFGICGRNGAGKSTLLKILARVAEPTRGRARLRGRVSSLLEVGVGFHGDLTGRENVFLNGALLGMKRLEVQAALDAIVDFAGVARFLDTPVKHYSSGMQARLGFAVAAHLNQDILILDEVLAVGDAAFQRKCFETVTSIAQGGKTILLVSHNMVAIERFCTRAILINEGKVQLEGPPDRIIAQYLADTEAAMGVRDTAAPNDEVLVQRVSVRTDAGPGRLRGRIDIEAHMECLRPLDELDIGISVFNSAGHEIANAVAHFHGLQLGPQRLCFELVNPGLAPGDYFLGLAAMRPKQWMKLFLRAASFRIPTTVTDDPHMLEMLDLAGIALEVKATRVETGLGPGG